MGKSKLVLPKKYFSISDSINKINKKAISKHKYASLEEEKQKSNFNIFNHKWKILLMFAGILSFSILIIKNHGFNKGVDFTGGFVIETTCEKCDNGDEIVKQISEKLKISINYQKLEKGYLFKTNVINNYEQVLTKIEPILKEKNAKIVTTNFSSPQITKTFINDSIFACIFAIVCISLYIMVRFNWKFACSAIMALAADVLVVISFISIKQLEVCLITLTAMLTIIGYNINDKIVVFDSIRSNLDLVNTPVTEIIKKSIKNVLFRSILTSVTTIVVAISTLFFGDRSIHELGLIIIYGIIIGTISSLLLAPNLLLAFNVKHRSKKTIIKDPMWYAS